MEVSSNWGTRKSSILHDFTGFSINDPAIGVPPFMEPPYASICPFKGKLKFSQQLNLYQLSWLVDFPS